MTTVETPVLVRYRINVEITGTWTNRRYENTFNRIYRIPIYAPMNWKRKIALCNNTSNLSKVSFVENLFSKFKRKYFWWLCNEKFQSLTSFGEEKVKILKNQRIKKWNILPEATSFLSTSVVPVFSLEKWTPMKNTKNVEIRIAFSDLKMLFSY